jgi:ureidoglycolate lyase
MSLHPAPLTPAAFAPFGHVTALPRHGARDEVGPMLNLRPGVAPRLRWTTPPPAALPLHLARMERHCFSSQSFIPLATVRWLIVVAPHAAGGGPDMARAQAFLADGEQAITYAPDVWHHPLTALSEGARFAVLTFLDGSPADEEFAAIAEEMMVLV